jgi:glyoxylase-like metal-dependent hydrolase (beta-lactamase superfamily II)
VTDSLDRTSPPTATPAPVREERRPARDEVDEVAPGVLRIQLPISMPGLGHVNCYAMEDSRGVTLVDPGLPGPLTWRQLKRRMASAGLPVRRVHTVVVTHSHPDHFGQAARLRSRYGAEVITHHSFRTMLDAEAEQDDHDSYTVLEASPDADPTGSADPASSADGGEPVHRSARVKAPTGVETPFSRETPWGGQPFQAPLPRRMRFWAMRWAAGRFVATPSPTRRVEEAEVVVLGGREWVSVHTPGHTHDHLCLWDPANGIMISGDHVLPTITPHISGLGATVDPLADFFRSLERMQAFDGVTTVLPAHGLAFSDLAGRADSIMVHHHERLETLRQTGGEIGPAAVTDYMKRLFQPRSWGSMAESETYAHLEHLRLLGQAGVSSDGSQLRYEIFD